jgi:hypothetical protein
VRATAYAPAISQPPAPARGFRRDHRSHQFGHPRVLNQDLLSNRIRFDTNRLSDNIDTSKWLAQLHDTIAPWRVLRIHDHEGRPAPVTAAVERYRRSRVRRRIAPRTDVHKPHRMLVQVLWTPPYVVHRA